MIKGTLMKFGIRLLFLFLLLLSTLVAESPKTHSLIDDILKRGSIRVGMSVFVPWAFRSKSGEYIGYEIDVAKQLAKDLGVKLQLVPTAWDGIIPALQAKKMDVIIAGMSITAKRNLKVNFSIPYGGTELVALAGIKHQGKLKRVENFNKRNITIAVRRGSTPAQVAKNLFPKAKIRRFDDDSISTQEVVNGKADLTIDTATAAFLRIKEYPKALYLVENAKVLSKTPSAFALRKGDVDALNVFNNWIRVKTESGWLKARDAYWFRSTDWKDKQ